MASFTDNLQSLTNFTPYRQQIPLEEEKQVGMYKQAKFEEGVQKIQTNIDNIGGLDVMRDIDKTYLQSKLNQLGNDLTKVAAGDFSNFQLVNSVNGMTNQIAKDNIIQSAVAASSNDKKQMTDIEDSRKKGTLAPHAEYDYQLQRNSYFNNNNLTDDKGNPISYSGKYTQAWDIDKNILEAIKAVGDSNWTADNVFKLDSNKQPMYNKDGTPMYSEFAIREKRAGKFPENISAAIDSVLSRPEAKKELAMQGVYNYRGYTNINDFVQQYQKEKVRGLEVGESKKLELMSKILVENNPEIKKQYQTLLGNIESQMTELSQKSDAEVVQAQGYENSLDGYKAALQTQRKRNDYMKMGVTETYSKEYIESIPHKVKQQDIKAERDWAMALGAARRDEARISQAAKYYKLNKYKVGLQERELNAKLPPKTSEIPLEGAVTPSELHTKLIEDGIVAENTMQSVKNKFVFDYISALNYGNKKSVTKEEVQSTITKYQKSDPDFIDRMFIKGKKDVQNNPTNKYFTDLSTHLATVDAAEENVAFQADKIKRLNTDPKVIAAGGKEVDIEKISKLFTPISIEYEGTESLGLFGGNRGFFQPQEKYTKTITAKDAVDLAIIKKFDGGLLGAAKYLNRTDVEKAQYEQSSQRILDKFKIKGINLLEQMHAINPIYDISGNLYKRNKSLDNVFNMVDSQKFSNVLKAKEDVLQGWGKGNTPLVYTAYPKDAKGPEINSVNKKIQAVLGQRKNAGMDVSEFAGAFKDPNSSDITFTIDRDNNKAIMSVYDKDKQLKTTEISLNDLKYIKPEIGDIPAKVSHVEQLINTSPGKNTTNEITADPMNPEAVNGAHYKQSSFLNQIPNRHDVIGADIKKNGQGAHNVYFYIKNKNNEIEAIPYKPAKDENFPYKFPSSDAAEYFIKNATSPVIDNIINNSK